MINLLYVEDQPEQIGPLLDLLSIASMARKIPVTVRHVSALIEIQDAVCDAMLVDLELGSGIDHTIQWLEEHSDKYVVIILTASEGLEMECLRKGAEDYWHKPDVIKAPEIFIDAVNKAIIRHEARRKL